VLCADRLPSIKLRTTRRVHGDCLATLMTLGGGLKRRKATSQPQVQAAVVLSRDHFPCSRYVTVCDSGVAMGWAKSRGHPSEGAPEFQFQGQSYKEEER